MIDYFQLREGLAYELGTNYGFTNIAQERNELEVSKFDYSIKDDNGKSVPLSWIAVDDIEECIGSFVDDLNLKLPDEILEYIAKLEIGKTVEEHTITQQKPLLTRKVSEKNTDYLQKIAGTRQKDYFFKKDNQPVILHFD